MSMSRVSGLGRLSNRLDDEMQAKILGAVHTRVPMPTVDEIRALQLEHAKEHETAWRIRHTQTKGIVEANKALRDGASKMVGAGEPLLAAATEELNAAVSRRERIQRGETVPVSGKPPSLKELGITPAQAKHGRRITHSGAIRAPLPVRPASQRCAAPRLRQTAALPAPRSQTLSRGR